MLTTNIAIAQRIGYFITPDSINDENNMFMDFFIILGVSGVLVECKLAKNELKIVEITPKMPKTNI